jgi:hypothetical protein
MENIIQPNDSFNFSSLSLAHPTGIQGGAYFTKIYNNGKPLYIQTPKSLTKQGFVKNGKKIYADLMFDNNDEQFINWLENLETKCQELIFEKKDSWFENQLDKSDIETAFTSPMRIYKSGKFYLVRVNVKVSSSTNVPNVKIYNEHETPLTIDDITNDTTVISILEVQGIKFTSRNFQIEIELKQSMILNSDALFESCLIKTNAAPKKKNIEESLTEKEDEMKIKMQPIIPSSVDQEIKLENLETPIEDLEELSEQILDSENLDNTRVTTESTNDKDDVSVEYDLEEDDEQEEVYHPPLTFGSEIKPTAIIVNTSKPSVQFQNLEKEPDLNGLEEIDFDINSVVEEELEDTTELKEIDFASNLDISTDDKMTLKKPNQVYYEIYKQARKKAKQSKKEAIMAFLEAKNIKKTYMLEDLDESDSDNSDLDNIEDFAE